MSRADEVLAQARRRAERAAAAEAPESRPVPTAVRVQTKPVRRTVDLAPQQHKDLSQWCDAAAEDLGVTRVTGQDVLSALVNQLLADSALSARVRVQLAEEIQRRQVARSTSKT